MNHFWKGMLLATATLLTAAPSRGSTVTHSTVADFSGGSGDHHVSFTAVANGEVALQKLAGPIGNFNTLASLPFAMAQVGLFSSSTHLYLAGMADASDNPRNNVYSAAINGSNLGPWTPLGALPYTVKLPSLAVWRNHVYLSGGTMTGCCSYQATSRVVEADIVAGGSLTAWADQTLLPTSLAFSHSAASKGYLFVMGQSIIYSAPIHADGSLGTWSNIGSPPTTASGSVFASADGYLWSTAGDRNVSPFDNSTYSAQVHDDGSIGAWILQSGTPLPVPKTSFNATASDGAGSYYAAGGRTGLAGPWASTSVHSTQFVGSGGVAAWLTETAALPSARSAMGAIVSGGVLWCLGGADASFANIGSVYSSSIPATTANAHHGEYQNGFDLGGSYNLNSLSWNTNQSNFVSCQVRCADSSKIFGSWSTASSSSPIALTVNAQYLEYRFDLLDPGTGNDLYLDDVTLAYDQSPTPTPTASSTPTISSTATPSPSPSFSPTRTRTASAVPVPSELRLSARLPNPNPAGPGGIWLPYDVTRDCTVRIRIFDVAGEIVRNIASFDAHQGGNEEFWDGRSDSGVDCASGIYLYRIQAAAGSTVVEAWMKLSLIK